MGFLLMFPFLLVGIVVFAFVLSRYTTLIIVSVFFLVQFTELIKVILGFFMVKSGVWLQNIVDEA